MTGTQDDSIRVVRLSELVDALVVCLMNRRVYPPVHPRVRSSQSEILSALGALAGGDASAIVTLGVVDGFLVHEGRPLIGASLSAKRLIDAITERGSGAIQIDAATTEQDLVGLMTVLCGRASECTGADSANQRLQAEGCTRIRMLPPFQHGAAGGQDPRAAGSESGGTGSSLSSVQLPIGLYQSSVQLLQGLTIAVTQGEKLGFEGAQSCVEGLLERLGRDAAGLLTMARYEQHDAYTFGHSIRVGLLALNFGQHLTRDPLLLNRIGVAALLHDIGKSKIPFEVLHCRTRLDAEQKRVMEQHPVLGAQILLDNGGCDMMCVACAFGHHLTQGSGGYPKLQHTPHISLATKIVKICDVYEALTAVRPYKDPMSPLRAFRIMLSMRHHFDEPLLRRFIEINGLYPLGSEVKLTTGERARIEAQGNAVHLPVVRLLSTPQGEPLHVEDRVVMDLSSGTPARMGIRVESLLGVRDAVPALAGAG